MAQTSEPLPPVIYTGRAGEGMVFDPAGSGWALFRAGVDNGPLVFLHVTRTPEATVIDSTHVERMPGQPVTSDTLRAVPLGRLEAALNRPAHLELLATCVPEPQPIPCVPDTEAGAGWPWWMFEPARPKAPRLRLKVPEGHKKPDSFYEQVADRFAYLSSMSARPANDLAAANAVPVTTIHGWVKEARRRGFLAPGERTRKATQ